MKSKRVIIISLVIGIQLIGCLSGSSTPTPTLLVSEIKTSNSIPTSTPSPNPTSTNTFIPTATWTPLPTILPDEFSDTLLNLLNSNAGCELPCWLGIIPGKTTMPEAVHHFTQFPIEIGNIRNRETIYDGKNYLVSSFGFRVDISGKVVGSVDITSTDEILNTILIQFVEYSGNYQINQLLESFGKPNGVYISAQASSPIAELAPTILILDYRVKGILAWYEFPTIRIAENLRFCLNSKKTSLALWNPSFDVYRLPIDDYLIDITGFPSKPLADATTFTLNSFYEIFVNSSSGKCIETPANLWP